VLRFTSSITLSNTGDEQLENLKILVESDPETALAGGINVSVLEKGEEITTNNPLIRHSWDFFRTVNEKIIGRILIEVFNADGVSLGKAESELEIVPENVWLGQRAPLELVASHIMPNSNTIQEIVKRTSELIKEKTRSSALNGYQSKDKQGVYQMAQAIYHALREQKITYSEPPASFEETGQKVGTPEKVVQDGLATCLDISLTLVRLCALTSCDKDCKSIKKSVTKVFSVQFVAKFV
jgi:hypothetical protein